MPGLRFSATCGPGKPAGGTGFTIFAFNFGVFGFGGMGALLFAGGRESGRLTLLPRGPDFEIIG